MVEIRRTEPGDAERIRDLWIEVGLGRITEDESDALLFNPAAHVLIAVEGEELLGVAVASFDGWRAYLYHVAVAPAARRRGVARALIQAGEEELAAEGAHRVYLMVDEGNTEGWVLMGTAGYEATGEMVLAKDLQGAE